MHPLFFLGFLSVLYLLFTISSLVFTFSFLIFTFFLLFTCITMHPLLHTCPYSIVLTFHLSHSERLLPLPLGQDTTLALKVPQNAL